MPQNTYSLTLGTYIKLQQYVEKVNNCMNKALKALGVLTTFVMLIVLIGGALVTKTGSGKAAADSGRCVTAVFSLK